MEYRVIPGLRSNQIWWEGLEEHPTLTEVIEAAQKEFPDTQFDDLKISAIGFDAEIIVLSRKEEP